ncbi:MAG: hypothetical protein RIF32_15500 [Leptospirales bacterium]|jgi:hypothetical protein
MNDFRFPAFSAIVDPRSLVGRGLICAVLLAFAQCSAYQLKSQEGKPVILETAGANCRVVKKKNLYSLLFGAVPLNPVEEGELFQGDGATYRLTDEVTTIDAVFSVLVGWALSMNRRTITVEACEENVRVANPETERKELDRVLAGFARNSRAPIVILNDGQSYQGRIVEFSDTEVAIETSSRPGPETQAEDESAAEVQNPEGDSDAADSDDDSDGTGEPVAYVDVIEMKNGQVKTGKVVSQNRERIVLQTGSGSEEIFKKNIQRVRYRVPESELEPKKEVVRIARENIRKIVIP